WPPGRKGSGHKTGRKRSVEERKPLVLAEYQKTLFLILCIKMPVGASHKEPLRTGGEHRYLTLVIPEDMLLRSKEDVLADSVDVPHVGEGACLRWNLIAQAMKLKEAVSRR